jgi:hypothetical protein
MLRGLLVAAVALTAGCHAHSAAADAPAPSATPAVATPTAPPMSDEALQRLQKRALYIVASERGAISASDQLVRRTDLEQGKINGFFTVPRGNAWYSVFGRVDVQGGFVPAYAYRAPIEFPDEMEALPVESLPEGLDAVARAVKASTERVREVHGRGQLNPVVVEQDDSITVYVLQGFNDPNLYLLGGDMRLRFSKDGRKQLEEEKLHESIIPVEVGPFPEGDRKPAANLHAHLSGPGPLETEFAVVMLYPEMGNLFVVMGKDRLYNLAPDGSIRVIGGEPANVVRELRPDGTFAPPEPRIPGDAAPAKP